jgi:hypothetical protein
MILANAGLGIRFNEHMEGDGETVFRHACKLGLEGIVSKRRDSTYRSGRSPDWLKMKNADAPAVKREAEEDWGKGAVAMSAAPESGRNRIMIYGPRNDGTYIVEFKTADGEALAINVPVGETRVLKHFQERMPYGLFVPEVA